MLVLLGRIELPTSPLPRVRSTTELQQQREGLIDSIQSLCNPLLDPFSQLL
ncbi:hypothetical protein ISM_02555 [Roseovarius nubinhibens ISM]|uniref:Uncharacterized protein n=1 Tax=Roseovarius nubinhibens (strain ATCC BAA-591 / DSM 15170 / ISM) TaxID=89187 RepID=A3SIF3_ROSNI|nr:hypothetical protein ISM_02555 [Roseovarius nubinhibens ISM]